MFLNIYNEIPSSSATNWSKSQRVSGMETIKSVKMEKKGGKKKEKMMGFKSGTWGDATGAVAAAASASASAATAALGAGFQHHDKENSSRGSLTSGRQQPQSGAEPPEEPRRATS